VSSIRTTTGILWTLALGAVALYVFFLALDAFNPGEAIWLAIAMGVVALACMVHFVRVRRALDDHQHDELARTVHAMREKRGF
jgi:heme exporter protein D